MIDNNVRLFGRSLFGDPVQQWMTGPVAERFLFSPFSVFNTQKEEWQKRKRSWLRIGIKSELGRKGKAYNIGLEATKEWYTFCAAYKRIILKSIQRLKIDRFACFVVSNFRDKNGYYRDLIGETVHGFDDCKCKLYNDAILMTSIGTACLRTKQFEISRKLVKIHQNVLIFCKGDWKQAIKELKEENI